MNINEVIKTKEYDFLRTEERLGDNIIFLAYGGSWAYGTNNEDSDIDIRGCALNSKSDILGLTNFEQFEHNPTDTVIYSIRKLFSLLLQMNPNTCEILGSKTEHYALMTPIGQELIDNRKIFLSKKALNTFSGYALQQLYRLKNAVARDANTPNDKEKHIAKSIIRSMETFNDRYAEFENGTLNVYVGPSKKEYKDTEILIDADFKGFPLRDFYSMFNEMNLTVKNYDKLNHRNKKKTEKGLAKHAMHLLRLYLMALDIFEKEEIITYRENDLEFLMEIRNGKYMNEDGTYQAEFFELVDEYEKRLKYAADNTSIPEQPDFKKAEELLMSFNQRAIS